MSKETMPVRHGLPWRASVSAAQPRTKNDSYSASVGNNHTEMSTFNELWVQSEYSKDIELDRIQYQYSGNQLGRELYVTTSSGHAADYHNVKNAIWTADAQVSIRTM